MVIPQPIYCPNPECKALVVDDARNLTCYVIQPPGIACRACGTMVIPATQIICAVDPSVTDVIMTVASTTFTG